MPDDFNVGMLLANLRKDLLLENEHSLFIYTRDDSKKRRLLKSGTRASPRRAHPRPLHPPPRLRRLPVPQLPGDGNHGLVRP